MEKWVTDLCSDHDRVWIDSRLVLAQIEQAKKEGHRSLKELCAPYDIKPDSMYQALHALKRDCEYGHSHHYGYLRTARNLAKLINMEVHEICYRERPPEPYEPCQTF